MIRALSISRKLLSSVKRLRDLWTQQQRRWTYRFSEGPRWAKLENRYRGQRCFIVGNGPSLGKQDLTQLKDEVTFVANWFALHEDTEQIDPTFYCICGEQFFGGGFAEWREDGQFDPDLYGLLQRRAASAIKVFPFFFKAGIESQDLFASRRVRYCLYEPKLWQPIWKAKRMKLDVARDPLYQGHSVVISFCLPIAYYLGFRDIYLIGCDCDYGIEEPGDPRQYFYDIDEHKSKAPPFDWLQKSWASDGPMIQSFAVARMEFERRGRRIYNATAGGKLDVFPRVRFEDVVSRRQ